MSDLENLIPSSDEMPRYSRFKMGYNVIINLLLKIWSLCSICTLIFILLYCGYGGILPIIFLHIGIVRIIYKCQDKLLYHPDTPPDSRLFVPAPHYFGLTYENHYIRTPDGYLLHAYLLKHAENPRSFPTLIHFHGNAGNIGHRLHDASHLFKTCKMNVILLDYRGYGKSTGSPSESGIILDASTTLNFFSSHRDLDSSKFILFGRSLGGAVAINMAANDINSRGSYMALIVENTFTSIPHMALTIFKINLLTYVPEIFYKNKFLSEKYIRKIDIPALFLSGLRDEVVPPTMMGYLFQICSSPMKRLVSFSTGNHNDTWTCVGYFDAINRFISEVNDFRDRKPVAAINSYNV